MPEPHTRNEPSDESLIEAFRQGDREALETLLVRYQPNIYRFGVRMCRDPEDAKDILQDTMLAAARSLHDFRGTAAMSTWLYTIARNFCIKKHRKAKFAPQERSLDSDETGAADRIPGATRTPEENLVGQQVGVFAVVTHRAPVVRRLIGRKSC